MVELQKQNRAITSFFPAWCLDSDNSQLRTSIKGGIFFLNIAPIDQSLLIYIFQFYFLLYTKQSQLLFLLAQGPSGPDLAPQTRKVPARRSPESSELMQFETWGHLEPLETPWSVI